MSVGGMPVRQLARSCRSVYIDVAQIKKVVQVRGVISKIRGGKKPGFFLKTGFLVCQL